MGKLRSLDLSNRKSLVQSKLEKLPKTIQCELLDISRSTTYYKVKPLSIDKLSILNRIDEIYTDNPEFGYRYIYHQLLEDGFAIGKDRILQYMRMMGIEAIYPHKKKFTSVKDNEHKVYRYLLDQYWTKSDSTKTVHVPNVNEVWSGDITYIRTHSGFMYMASIID